MIIININYSTPPEYISAKLLGIKFSNFFNFYMYDFNILNIHDILWVL